MSPNGRIAILANRLAFQNRINQQLIVSLWNIMDMSLCLIVLQVIYNETMTDQPDDVRSALTFQSARQAMKVSRKKSIPPCPSTLEEIIAGLDTNQYPPLYQDMYIGTVHHDRKRKFLP